MKKMKEQNHTPETLQTVAQERRDCTQLTLEGTFHCML
jgi:hypothetical protein